MKTTLRSWATPLAIGAFTISSVTGLLIFFDVDVGRVESVHKWFSWLLVSGVLLHVLSNRRPFTGYFSKKVGLGIVGTAVTVTVVSLLPVFGDGKEEGEEDPGTAAAQALESSSLETVALVVRSTPQRLVEQLGKSGIQVKDPRSTLRDIAASNGKSGKAVLGAVLGQAGGSGTQEEDDDRD
jgi:hypothetical protein